MGKINRRICAGILSIALALTSAVIPASTKTAQAADQNITGTRGEALSSLYMSGAASMTKGTGYVVTMNGQGKKVDQEMEYTGYIGKGFRLTTGSQNSFYEVYAVNSSVPGDVICNIYNSQFQNIGQSLGGENSIPTSESIRTRVKLEPSSTYYFVLATENSENLKNSPKARILVTEITDDHSDTKDKATTGTIGTQYNGRADGPGDVDFFKYQTPQTSNFFTLSLQNHDIQNELGIELYDSRNEIIAEGTAETGQAFRQTLALDPRQTYHVKVFSGDQDADVYSDAYNGKYTMQLAIQEDDYPDTMDKAKEIKINQEYTGSIQHEEDYDIVKFNTGDLSTVKLTASNKSTASSLEYQISSEYGDITSGSVDSRGKGTELMEELSKNTDYYLIFSGETGTDYSFGIYPVSHMVTYDLDGGINNPGNVPYYYETEHRELLAPTKTGYAFEGWYTTKNHTYELTEDDDEYDSENPENNIRSSKITHVGSGTKDIVLYANWEVKSYKVTFMDGEKILKEQEVNHGEAAEAPEISKPGYTLKWDKQFSAITKETTVKASWTPNTYTVKFDPNGGIGTMSQRTTRYGNEITLSSCRFTKEGHHFAGWLADGKGELIKDGATVSNLTTEKETILMAQWEKDVFTISYTDGNAVVETEAVEWGMAAKGPTVKRAGYTAVCREDLSCIKESREARVEWVPNNYTIRYNSNNGTGSMRPTAAIYEQDVTLNKNTFTRTGYDFAGWSLEKNGKAVYGDADTVHNVTEEDSVTLYAQWEKHAYTIEFRDGNKTVKTDKVLYLDPATPPVLNKQGYILTWDSVFSEIRGDMVISAVWAPVSYTINYDANGGSGMMGSDAAVYDNFQKLQPCQFTRPGHDFAGWSLTPSGEVLYRDSAMAINLTASENITLYAQWTRQKYTVEFISDGMSAGTATVGYGDPVTPPALSKPGFTLAWDRDLSSITSGGQINAIWTQNQYTIIFHANGGKGSMPAVTVPFGQAVKLGNKFRRTNYKFLGWKIENRGSLLESGDEVRNLAQGGTVTLYAQWKADLSKPGSTKIISVKASGKKVTVKFKKSSKAHGYTVSYSMNRKMKKAKSVNVKNTKAVLKKLKKGKVYFITIKAYRKVAGKTIYGKASKTKKIKI